MEKPFEPWLLRLEMAAAPRSGDIVARLEDAVVWRGSWQLGPIDLDVRWGDRLGVLGRNGAGKTTLLSMILGTMPLEQGKRWIGPRVVFGELGQARRRFGTSAPLLAGFLAASSLNTREARSLLAKFGLGSGEVERSVRNAVSWRADTGTTGALDVQRHQLPCARRADQPSRPSRHRAARATLTSWNGTLLLVTHDRRLLDAVTLTATLELGDGPGSGPAHVSDAGIYARGVNDTGAMAVALGEATLALEHDDVPVGAVVLVGGHVVAQRHNEPSCARTRPPTPKSSPCRTPRSCWAPGTSTAPRSL